TVSCLRCADAAAMFPRTPPEAHAPSVDRLAGRVDRYVNVHGGPYARAGLDRNDAGDAGWQSERLPHCRVAAYDPTPCRRALVRQSEVPLAGALPNSGDVLVVSLARTASERHGPAARR